MASRTSRLLDEIMLNQTYREPAFPLRVPAQPNLITQNCKGSSMALPRLSWANPHYLEQSRSWPAILVSQARRHLDQTNAHENDPCVRSQIFAPRFKKTATWANLRALSEYIVSKHIVCQERHCM